MREKKTPTMLDAIREELSPEELRAFISEEMDAIIRRDLKAMGFPVLPEGVLRITKEEK